MEKSPPITEQARQARTRGFFRSLRDSVEGSAARPSAASSGLAQPPGPPMLSGCYTTAITSSFKPPTTVMILVEMVHDISHHPHERARTFAANVPPVGSAIPSVIGKATRSWSTPPTSTDKTRFSWVVPEPARDRALHKRVDAGYHPLSGHHRRIQPTFHEAMDHGVSIPDGRRPTV